MALTITKSTVYAGAVYQIGVWFLFGSTARSGEVSNQSEHGSLHGFLPLSLPSGDAPTLLFELHYAPDGTPVIETATIHPLPSGSSPALSPQPLNWNTGEPAPAGAGGKEAR